MVYLYRRRLALIALMALTAGTLVYLIDRPGDAVPFFSYLNVSTALPTVFGALGYSLPTFSHVFSFSILTALMLGKSQKAAAFSCASWSLINLTFELGQHDVLSRSLATFFESLAKWTSSAAQAQAYFAAGTFDVMDLLAAIAGGGGAYLMLRFSYSPTGAKQ